MRKDTIFKYFIVGVLIFVLDLLYKTPQLQKRFFMIITFVIILGVLLERLYFFMLTRKSMKWYVRLIITIPLSILILNAFALLLDKYNGFSIYISLLTAIGAIILDQINSRLYLYNHKQVNNQLKVAKSKVTH